MRPMEDKMEHVTVLDERFDDCNEDEIIDALLAEDFRRSMHYLSEEELERTLSL